MALLLRIYFNAVFGALGGLLGWMLFGIFGDKSPSEGFQQVLQMLIAGALIGGLIGYFVVSVEAIRDRSLMRFTRHASYGVALGAAGGALGVLLGDQANTFLVWLFQDALVWTMLARGLGWMLIGAAIGACEGIAARSLRRVSYGTVGGTIGGFIGGVLFELFDSFSRQSGGGSYFWNALGLIILGACIGSLSALVQVVFLPACVKVMRGWQEGREYPLDKPSSLLGRDEHADIALFRDMKVEKRHAYIQRQDGEYVLVNNHAPPDFTKVNDVPVVQSRLLQDGDRIQLGNVLLRFQMRAAVNRLRTARRPPTIPAGPFVPTSQIRPVS
jgi:hypothetical protein